MFIEPIGRPLGLIEELSGLGIDRAGLRYSDLRRGADADCQLAAGAIWQCPGAALGSNRPAVCTDHWAVSGGTTDG